MRTEGGWTAATLPVLVGLVGLFVGCSSAADTTGDETAPDTVADTADAAVPDSVDPSDTDTQDDTDAGPVCDPEVCKALEPPVCHGPGFCDDGVCRQGAPLAAGTACDDGDPCTIDDACEAGLCEGTPKPLDDGDPCTADSCSDGTVVHETLPDGTACPSLSVCSETASCLAGTCTPLTPCECTLDDDCEAGENPCVGVPTCSEDGECVAAPVSGACDDGDPCSPDGTCSAGACVPATPDCDDGDPCTTDSCGEVGCEHVSTVAGCAACPAAGTCLVEPCDLTAVLAEATGSLSYPSAEPGEAIEIVQGPQGGVHLEIAVGLVWPDGPSGSVTQASLALSTHLGCCDTEPVGTFESGGHHFYSTDGLHWTSTTATVIFNTDLGSDYADQTCCVTGTVTTNDPETTTHVAHTFECVDFF